MLRPYIIIESPARLKLRLSLFLQPKLIDRNNPPDAIALQYLFNHLYLSIKKKITFVVIQPPPYSEVNPSIDQFDEVYIT
jgi:hypothetical protein